MYEGTMKVYILGNGGFAQEVFTQIILTNQLEEEFGGFVILKEGKAILIGEEGSSSFEYPMTSRFVLGTGNKKWRREFIEHFTQMYQKNLMHFPNVSAPTAHISSLATLGIGNVFCSYAMMNANAQIGNFNNFNAYASIHHDAVFGDNNVLSPYAGCMGFVKMGDENFLGVSTHIVPKTQIGNENTLSAGETLFDDMTNRQFFQSGVIVDKP